MAKTITCELAREMIEDFVKSLPPVSHDMVNIATSDDRAAFICKHCSMIADSRDD